MKLLFYLIFTLIIFLTPASALPPPAPHLIDNPVVMETYRAGLKQYSRIKETADGKLAPAYAAYNYPTAIGDARICVILLQFSNRTASQSSTKQKYYDLLFNESTGSLKKYYKDVSYNKYNITGTINDIHGWYTSSRTMEYYGEDAGGGIDNKNTPINNMIKEALDLAKANGVDFSQYDLDNDGVVDHLLVIHAGGDQANGSANDIWSHGWFVNGNSTTPYYPVSSPKGFANYITIAENSSIGLLAHEYGHDIGLIDTYKTNVSGGQSIVGKWDLMDYGLWNNSGNTPAAPIVYHKIQLGWIVPEIITSKKNYYSLQTVYDTPQAIKIPHPTATDPTKEYYLISNRRAKDWDYYLPGQGILIWHINDAMGTMYDNDVQNYNPPRIRLVPQDNTSPPYNRGDAGDPWKNDTVGLTATSIPNNAAYNGQTYFSPIISNIEISSDTMLLNLLSGVENIENIFICDTSNFYFSNLELSWDVFDTDILTILNKYRILIFSNPSPNDIIIDTLTTETQKSLLIYNYHSISVIIYALSENGTVLGSSKIKHFYDTSSLIKTDFNEISIISLNTANKTDTVDYSGLTKEYFTFNKANDTYIIFEIAAAANIDIKLNVQDNSKFYINAPLKKKSRLIYTAQTSDKNIYTETANNNNELKIKLESMIDISIFNESGTLIDAGFEDYFDKIELSWVFPDGINPREYEFVYYNNSTGRWQPLNVILTKGQNYIKTEAEHLTVFAVRRASDYIQPAQLIIYPNPWDIKSRRSGADIFEDSIKFCYQTDTNYYDFDIGTTLKIYDISGKLVRTIIKDTNRGNPEEFTGSSLSVLNWDLKNDAGTNVASGVYLVYIRAPEGRTFTGKCAVIR